MDTCKLDNMALQWRAEITAWFLLATSLSALFGVDQLFKVACASLSIKFPPALLGTCFATFLRISSGIHSSLDHHIACTRVIRSTPLERPTVHSHGHSSRKSHLHDKFHRISCADHSSVPLSALCLRDRISLVLRVP